MPDDQSDSLDTESADEPTSVIFSLTVHSDVPIAALNGFPGRTRPPRANDDVFYSIFHTSFVEDRWDARADKLDAAIHAALDALDASGVDPTLFEGETAAIRAFFTFDPGAETITADVVKRLAGYNATIWIDANR